MVKQLRKVLREGKAALADDDMETVVAANSELHSLITSMSGNAVLAEMIGMVDRRVRWYYRPLAKTRGATSWKEHTELITAIAHGDEEAAADVMRRHTEATRTASHEPRAADTGAATAASSSRSARKR